MSVDLEQLNCFVQINLVLSVKRTTAHDQDGIIKSQIGTFRFSVRPSTRTCLGDGLGYETSLAASMFHWLPVLSFKLYPVT